MKRISYAACLLLFCFSCKETSQSSAGSNLSSTQEDTSVKTMRTANQTDSASPGKAITLDFENSPIGKLPQGWSTYKNGQGQKINWAVVNEGGNRILAQLADGNANSHFNVIVYDSLTAKNISLQTRFKSIKGKKDQGGGFVWRFKDAGNYYIVRGNPLEDNVVLYKVENGRRTDLPLVGKGKTYGTDVEVPENTWNNLRLEAQDSLFTVYLNNQEIFRVIDKTFTQAGKIGYWTKADAVTYFDDLEITVKE
jgi:hypothetical protein